MHTESETLRLFIRPITTADHEFIFTLVNSKGWLQFIGDRNVRNSDDAVKYIEKILSIKNFYYSVFELKETKQPIGIITFLYRDNLEFPDIGFAMLPEFEKKGYAFEAVKKYFDEIIKHEISPVVFGITIPGNKQSVQLLTKLGLEFQYNFTKGNEELSLYSITLKE